MAGLWQGFVWHVSPVESILNREDFTLEDLLQEEETVQEVKGHNTRLLEFLSQPDVLKELFDYILIPAPADASIQRRLKYPQMACEVLAAENISLRDAIYKQMSLVERLYDFLAQAEPKLPELVFVCRVAGSIVDRKTLPYLKKRGDFVDNIMKHFHVEAVKDLMLSFIRSHSELDEVEGVTEYLVSQGFLEKLIDKFDVKNSEDVHVFAGDALCEIISETHNSESKLMLCLKKEENIKRIFGYILDKGAKSSLRSALRGVSALLIANSVKTDTTTTYEKLPGYLKIILSHCSDLAHLLENPEKRTVSYTFGDLTPPLGFDRLALVEFFVSLHQTGYSCVNSVLVEKKIINVLFNLFFHYCWNNFLHIKISTLVMAILKGDNLENQYAIFAEGGLAKKMIKAAQDSVADLKAAGYKGQRRGYMEFILQWTKELIKPVFEKNAKLKDYITGLEGWNAYINGYYKDFTALKNAPPMSPSPRRFDSDEADMTSSLISQMLQNSFSNVAEEDSEEEEGEDSEEDAYNELAAEHADDKPEGEDESASAGDSDTSGKLRSWASKDRIRYVSPRSSNQEEDSDDELEPVGQGKLSSEEEDEDDGLKSGGVEDEVAKDDTEKDSKKPVEDDKSAKTEAKPADNADTKPADTKAADTRPTDVKLTDNKAGDTKPTEKAADTKPTDVKLTDNKAGDTKPADTKAADTKPTDVKLTDNKAGDTKPTEKAADTKSTDTKTADQPVDTKADEKSADKPADTKATDDKTEGIAKSDVVKATDKTKESKEDDSKSEKKSAEDKSSAATSVTTSASKVEEGKHAQATPTST